MVDFDSPIKYTTNKELELSYFLDKNTSLYSEKLFIINM